MKCFIIVLLLAFPVSSDDNANFEKLSKPLDASLCKTKNIADCLAYKYIQHYHPNAKEADWYRNMSVTHYFDYKVLYQNEREKGEIQFAFQSYSNGIEWNYWEDSVIIRIKDPLKLIDSKKVVEKMKENLESEFDRDYKIEKIIKTVRRTLQQNQPNPKEYYSIQEEIKYKVRVNGRNLLFKGNGETE